MIEGYGKKFLNSMTPAQEGFKPLDLAPIPTKSGDKYYPVIEEIVDYGDESVKLIDTSATRAFALRNLTLNDYNTGNIYATKNGLYTIEGVYIVRRDLETLQVLATSPAMSGTNLWSFRVFDNGDYIYVQDYDHANKYFYRLNPLTLAKAATSAVQTGAAMQFTMTKNGVYFTLSNSTNRITKLNKDTLSYMATTSNTITGSIQGSFAISNTAAVMITRQGAIDQAAPTSYLQAYIYDPIALTLERVLNYIQPDIGSKTWSSYGTYSRFSGGMIKGANSRGFYITTPWTYVSFGPNQSDTPTTYNWFKSEFYNFTNTGTSMSVPAAALNGFNATALGDISGLVEDDNIAYINGSPPNLMRYVWDGTKFSDAGGFGVNSPNQMGYLYGNDNFRDVGFAILTDTEKGKLAKVNMKKGQYSGVIDEYSLIVRPLVSYGENVYGISRNGLSLCKFNRKSILTKYERAIE